MSTKSSRKFNFKSTGVVTEEINQDQEQENLLIPIGIKFPLQQASEVGSTFEMTTNIKYNIRQNLSTWLRTNWGERLGEYNYGANLIELLPELVQNNNQNAIRDTVKVGIATYFPYITLENFQVLSFEETPSFDIYTVRIIYSAQEIFEGPDSISLTLKYMRT